MHALDLGRIDEYFELRSRQWNLGKASRIELDRYIGFWRIRAVDGLKVIAAQSRIDATGESRENTIFVNVARPGDTTLDLRADFFQFAIAFPV